MLDHLIFTLRYDWISETFIPPTRRLISQSSLKFAFDLYRIAILRIWTNSWNSRSFTVKHMSKKLPAWMLVGRILGLLFIATRSVISRCPGNVCFVLCIYILFLLFMCVCSKKSTIVCYTGEFIVHVPNSSFHSVVEFLDKETGVPWRFSSCWS